MAPFAGAGLASDTVKFTLLLVLLTGGGTSTFGGRMMPFSTLIDSVVGLWPGAVAVKVLLDLGRALAGRFQDQRYGP